MKALLFVGQRYKEDSDKIIDDIKMKIKEARNQMEKVDLKLVECFHGVIQRKRTQSLYFETFGQAVLVKCLSKGVEITLAREHLMSKLFQYNFWQTQMAYAETLKRPRLDEDAYIHDSFDSVLFDIMKF